MYILLRNLGFEPTMVAPSASYDLYFIKKYLNIREIKNFSEIKENDYDILMVNSDQTWSACQKEHFYDYAFLRFAQNWAIPKFTYAASFAREKWPYSNETNMIIKSLLKNFTGISLREKDSVKEIENNLGIKPAFVLDPTFLNILNLIKSRILFFL